MASVVAGDRVGDRFEIVRPLGRGAHGQLFVAVQHPLGREVAVKLLRNQGLGSTAVRAFRQEAAALARLAHPCCVQVVDYGSWNGQLYLVMELVQGRSLRALMLGSPVPIPRAVSIALQISRGLAHAHREGIVHRDLTPANVMVLDDEVDGIGVKLVDFGLALVGSAHDNPALRSHGTPSYMAPERVNGEPGDARSDVYAAGLILFEMLTGSHPFRRDTPQATLAAHLSEPVPDLAELLPGARVPAALAFAVRVATARDPADRPVDGGQLRKLMIAALLATGEMSDRDGVPSLDQGIVVVPDRLQEPATSPSGIGWAYRTMEPPSSVDARSAHLPLAVATAPTQTPVDRAMSEPGSGAQIPLGVLGISLLATSIIALGLLAVRLVLG